MFPWVQSVAFFLVASEKCRKDSAAQRKGPCKQQSLGTWGLPLRSQENIFISKEAWQACLAAVPRSWAVPHARAHKVPVSYLRAGSTCHSLSAIQYFIGKQPVASQNATSQSKAWLQKDDSHSTAASPPQPDSAGYCLCSSAQSRPPAKSPVTSHGRLPQRKRAHPTL